MKRALNTRINFILILVLLIPILIIRCTPEKKFRTLSFFFDGVPDPNAPDETTLAIVTDTLAALKAQKNLEPEFFMHKPYEENKCESCHERGFSNSLIIPTPGLCYTCHDDFSTKFKSLHGPVASGYCTGCHNQHMAKNDHLLERSGQELCLYCHESKQVLRNPIHKDIGTRNCTDCHSPHGGDNRGMLVSSSCSECHTPFDTKYAMLHGPVASGYCTACHGSHSSGTPKLLLRESQQLCLYCHDSKQVNNNKAHKNIKKSNCTDCHNPHGGSEHYFLSQLIVPGKLMKKNEMQINNADSVKEKDFPTPQSDSLLINEEAPVEKNPNDSPEVPK